VSYILARYFRLRTWNSLSTSSNAIRNNRINTRIYSPIKNSEDHDPMVFFYKQWLPELAGIPVNLIHEPWKLNMIEQQFYDCEIGKVSCPINIEETRRYASDIV
jgi:deoxyribodipyrimidine photo-lyase